MASRRARSRSARLIIVLTTAIIALVALWSWSARRNGLFNNAADQEAALASHQDAWGARGMGNRIGRLDLLMMTRSYDGDCLTSEADWVAVPLDQRLDPSLFDGQPLIECRFNVRGRLPEGLYSVYSWTLLLKAEGPERLRLVETRRQTVK